MRIHLDRVTDLGTFLELEGVATADSDLADEREQVARLTEALEIGPERILHDSYADRILGAAGLAAAAREVMAHAYAPYSGLRVGAALRADDGSIHVGANVENAAYPQGQCAEASAIGALVSAGPHADRRGRGRLRRPRALRPVRRLPPAAERVRRPDTPDPPLRRRAAAQTTTLAALLPRSFGPESLARMNAAAALAERAPAVTPRLGHRARLRARWRSRTR